MGQPSLLFVGACARVVDENLDGNPRQPCTLRAYPRAGAAWVADIPIGSEVLIVDGPRLDKPPKRETAWWAVRVLSGAQRDRLGWVAEVEPGTRYYKLREVAYSEEMAA